MTNYVQLTTSVSELISAARGLRSEGSALRADLDALLRDVESLDVESSFPMDDFTEQFKQRLIPEDGGEPANLATREAAREISEVLEPLGDNVMAAMFGYQGTDVDSAGDIQASDVPPV